MKKFTSILLLSSFFSIVSCKKDNQEQSVFWFYYVETRCDNAFEIENNPKATMQNFIMFLSSNNIRALENYSNKYFTRDACPECNCTKEEGYAHYVLIESSKKGLAKNLGLFELGESGPVVFYR